jgi:uncharacterized protein with PQ loop repeat
MVSESMFDLSVFGVIAPVSVLFLNISLLDEIRMILVHRSIKNISMPYFVALSFVNLSWTLYGIFLSNYLMIFAQGLGLLLSFVIIALWIIYKR